MNEGDFRQILELAQKRDDKLYAWVRWLIALASGAFAVLVALHDGTTQAHHAGTAMKIAWTTLGVGIIAGSVFLYGEVWTARRLVKLLANQKIDDPHNPKPITAGPPLIIQISEAICYVSLLLAVASMVIYGLVR